MTKTVLKSTTFKKIFFSIFLVAILFLSIPFITKLIQIADAKYIQDNNVGYYLVDFKTNTTGVITNPSWISNINLDTSAGTASLTTGSTSGHFYTSTVAPLSFKSWKNLELGGNWASLSDVTYSVIGGTVADCSNITTSTVALLTGTVPASGNIDISSIDKTTYPCLQVRIDLNKSGTIAPNINKLKVTWTPLPVLLITHTADTTKQVGQDVCYTTRYSLSYVSDKNVVVYVPLPSDSTNTILYPGTYPNPGSATNPTSSYSQIANPTFSTATNGGLYTSTAIVGTGSNGVPVGTTIPANSVYWLLGDVSQGTTDLLTHCLHTQNGWQNGIVYQSNAYVASNQADSIISDSNLSVSGNQPVLTTLNSTPAIKVDKVVTGGFDQNGTMLLFTGSGAGVNSVAHYKICASNNPSFSSCNSYAAAATVGIETLFDPILVDNLAVNTSVSDILLKLQSPVCGSLNHTDALNRITNISNGGSISSDTITWNSANLGGNMNPNVRLDLTFDVDFAGCSDGTVITNKAIFDAINTAEVSDNASLTTTTNVTASGLFAKGDKVRDHLELSANEDNDPLKPGYNSNFYQPQQDNYSYELSTVNNGFVALGNIWMIDKIPNTTNPVTAGVPLFESVNVPSTVNSTIYYHTGGSANATNTPPDFDTATGVISTGLGQWSTIVPTDPHTVKWIAIKIDCLSSSVFQSPEGNRCNPTGANNTVPSSIVAEVNVKLSSVTPAEQCINYTVTNKGNFYVYQASTNVSNLDSNISNLVTPLSASNDENTYVRPNIAVISTDGSSTVSPAIAEPGQIVEFTHEFENTQGTATANSVQVTIDVPQNTVNGVSKYLDLVSITAGGGAVDMSQYATTHKIIINYGNLPVGAKRTFKVSYRIPVGFETTELVKSQYKLTAVDPKNCNSISFVDSSSASVQTSPKLNVYKSRSEAIIPTGDKIHYDLYYQNTGDGVSSDTWVVDRIPYKTVFEKAYTTGTDGAGHTFTCANCEVYFSDAIPNLPANSSPMNVFDQNLIFQYFTKGTESPAGTWTPSNISADKVLYVAYRVHDVIFNSNRYLTAGGSGHAGLQVHNDDDGALSGTVGSPEGTLIDNYSAIFSNELLQAIGNQVFTTILSDPGLDLKKSSSVDYIYAGEQFDWYIDYVNNSGNSDTGVVLTDTLPNGISFISAYNKWNPTAVTNSAPNGATEYNITTNPNVTITNNPDGTTKIVINVAAGLRAGDLQKLEGGRIRIHVGSRVTAPTGSIFENTVIGNYSNNIANYEIQDYDTVEVQNPDLYIRKFVDKTDPLVGDTITYTLVLSNKGLHDAPNVNFSDKLPANMCFVSGSTQVLSLGWTLPAPAVTGTCATTGQTLTWNNVIDGPASTVGIIPANSEDTIITYKATITGALPAGTVLTNNANTSTSITEDTNYPNSTNASVTIPFVDLSTSKSVPATTNPGELFSYTILYSNLTRQPATGTYLIDTLPSSPKATLVSVSTSNGEIVCYSNQISQPVFASGLGCSQTGWSSSLLPDSYFIAIDKGSMTGLEGPNKVIVTMKASDISNVKLPTGSILTNNVNIKANEPEEILINNNAAATTRLPNVDLAITKTGSVEGSYPGTTPGASLIYTIDYQNLSNIDACNIEIVDNLPNNITLANPSYSFNSILLKDISSGIDLKLHDSTGADINSSVVPIFTQVSATQLKWTLGSSSGTYTASNVCLPPHSHGNFQIFVNINNDVADSTQVVNNVVISKIGGTAEDILSNNTDDSSVTVYRADVMTEKDGKSCGVDNVCGNADDNQTFTNGGENIRYSVSYNNIGNVDAKDVILNEIIPSGTCFTIGSFTNLPTGANIQYSNDSGSTWSYTPVGAAGAQDCAVTNFRLVWSVNLPAPANYISMGGSSAFTGTFSPTTTSFNNTAGSGLSLLQRGFWQDFAETSGRANNLVVGDFDKDGKIDVAYSNNNGLQICYQTSNINSFDCRKVDSTSANYKLAVIDVNKDEIDDIAATTWNGPQRLCYGTTTRGALNCLIETNSPNTNTLAITVGDFNNDGYGDIFYGAHNWQSSFLCWGQSSQSALNCVNQSRNPVTNLSDSNYYGDSAYESITGDVNNDGIDDIVILNSYGPSRICYGRSSGGTNALQCLQLISPAFGTRNLSTVYQLSPTYQGTKMNFADINGDGYNDFVVPNSNSGASNDYVCYGRSGTTGPTCVAISDNNATYGVVLSDVNNDGLADVILDDNNVGTRICYGQSGAAPTLSCQSLFAHSGIATLQAGDINGDGVSDVLISIWQYTEVCYGSTIGSPNCVAPSFVSQPISAIQPDGSILVDLNNDHKLDEIGNLNAAAIGIFYGLNGTVQNNGYYQYSQSIPTGGTSWDKFIANSVIPNNTSLIYTICKNVAPTGQGTCNTASNLVYTGTINSPINISNAGTSNLYIRVDFSTTDPFMTPTLKNILLTYLAPAPKFTFDVKVTNPVLAGLRTVDNTVSIVTSTPETNYTNNNASDHLQLTLADVEITKTVDKASAHVGDTLTYTLNYKNNGPQDAKNVVITDFFPSGVIPGIINVYPTIGGTSSDTPICTSSGSPVYNIICKTTAGITLSPGESGKIVATVTIDGSVTPNTTLHNTTNITTSTAELTLDNNDSSADTVIGDYTNVYVEKYGEKYGLPVTSGDQAFLGNDLKYFIDYGNNGNQVANDFKLEDTFDISKVTYISFVQVSGTITLTCSYVNPKLTCTATSLPIGENGRLAITVKVNNNPSLLTDPKTIIHNDVIVSTTTPETTISDNSSSHDTPIWPKSLASLSGHVFVDRNFNVKYDTGATNPLNLLGAQQSDQYISDVPIFLSGKDTYGHIYGPDKTYETIYETMMQQLVSQGLIPAGTYLASEPYPANYTPISPVFTDSNGFYSFSSLNPGTYNTYESQPSGYASTGSRAGTNLIPNADNGSGSVSGSGIGTASNGQNINANKINSITLLEGDNSINNDFGEINGELGTQVWIDTNHDGIFNFTDQNSNNEYDSGEPTTDIVLPGVEISVYQDSNLNGQIDPTDTLVSVTQTDNTGRYLVQNLPLDETYLVKVTEYTDTSSNSPQVLVGMIQAPVVGGNLNNTNKLDSNYTVILNFANLSNYTADFGYEMGKIGNQVWLEDMDSINGVYNSGTDTPIKDVLVRLLDTNSNPVSEKYIDLNKNGVWDSGETFFDIDGDGTYDDGITKFVEQYTNATGQYNFVNVPLDIDYKVKILSSDTTTANSLSGLLSSVGPTNSIADNDSKDPTGYNVNDLAGGSSPITTNYTADFGYYLPRYTIGNRVWFDTNNNSTMDNNEVGISGVSVTLFVKDSSGNYIVADNPNQAGTQNYTVITDQNGYYKFDQLPEGSYKVRIDTINWNSVLAGYISSTNDDNSQIDKNDNGVDDTNPATNSIYSQTITLGETMEPTDEIDLSSSSASLTDFSTEGITGNDRSDLSVDFGFYKLTVGNYIWNDLNNNGLLDSGENGIHGVTVELYKGTSLVATVTTDTNGYYLFDKLANGDPILPGNDYTIQIPSNQSILLGYASSNDSTNSADPILSDSDDNGLSNLITNTNITNSAVFTLAANIGNTDNSTGITNQANIDFGFYLLKYDLALTKSVITTGPIHQGDSVTFKITVTNQGDIDATNIQIIDYIQNGLTLNDSNWTASGSNAKYVIPTLVGHSSVELEITLKVGNYYTTSTITNKAEITKDNGGDIDSTPANKVTTEDDYGSVTIPFDQLYGNISGTVWIDSNENMGLDSSENLRLDQVIINLKDSNGNIVASTFTNSNGYYEFTGLLLGDYIVEEIQPTNYVTTTPNTVSNISLTPTNLSSLNNNFGEVRYNSLSGFVYVDQNNNGLKETSELPISQVTVTLTGVDINGNNVNLVTTTDQNGYYEFTNLKDGTYKVNETQPSNYADGKDTLGTVAGITANDEFSNINLANGTNSIRNNFGELNYLKLSGTVWIDSNKNGIIDGSEGDRLNGITVTLKKSDGSIVATTTTNSSGYYEFTNLLAGDYIIEQTQPNKYITTTPNVIAATLGASDVVINYGEIKELAATGEKSLVLEILQLLGR